MKDLKGKKMLTEYTGRQQNGGGELCSDSFLILRNTWAQPETRGQGKAGFAVRGRGYQEKQQELYSKRYQTPGTGPGTAWGCQLKRQAPPLSRPRHFELPGPARSAARSAAGGAAMAAGGAAPLSHAGPAPSGPRGG